MVTQTITREQLIELSEALPSEKLISWYDYGLSLRAQAETLVPEQLEDEAALRKDVAMWDAASDQAWHKVEQLLGEEL